MKKIAKGFDRYFKISERNTTFAREIIAGLIVFLAMIYILPVNANILGSAGFPGTSVFIATALVSGITTLIMGVYGRYPIALSVGMGMNAFLAFTVCDKLGYSWEEGLALVIVAGVLFLLLSLTGLREKIIIAFPRDLQLAITAGLGFFIAFIGLKMGGIIVADSGTLVSLGRLSEPLVLLALFGILAAFALGALPGKLKRFAIIIAMGLTAALGLVLNYFEVENMPRFARAEGASLGAIFGKGFEHIPRVLLRPESYALIFSLIFVNLFDTTATLLAVGNKAGLLDERGKLVSARKAVYADAFGAVLGGVFGSSTVTSYAESTIGIEAGARTGLSAATAGVLFLLSMFLYPLFSVFSAINVGENFYTPVTSLALVAVGAALFSNLKDIDWSDKTVTFSAFAMILFMVLTYSLSDGIGFGIIVYVLMKVFSGKKADVSFILYLIAAFFLANFAIAEIIKA